MNQTNQAKILILDKQKIGFLVKFFILIFIAVASPVVFSHYQAFTGPIVNAVLFASVLILGIRSAVLIALIPSLIALSVGLLPAVLAPMVPFIMISNILLIITFDLLKKKNFWLGIISASFLKFLFLFSTSSIVISLVIKEELAAKIAAMMSWPQFFTAIAGGILAYFFLKLAKKI